MARERRESFGRVERVEHQPQSFEDSVLYLQCSGGEPHGATFLCPCGCGALLGVQFGPGGWTLAEHGDGTVTIRASVLHSTPGGCHSHFWITRNRVEWC